MSFDPEFQSINSSTVGICYIRYVIIVAKGFIMDINDQKEAFSRAYSCAIASVARYAISEPKPDKTSVDIIFQSQEGRCVPIEAQLKATSNPFIENDSNQDYPILHYPLPIKNYHDLSDANSYCPRVLIVLVLPSGFDDCPTKWIEQTSENLVLMKCAYWINLRGMANSENKATVTIKIPMDNEHIFTPDVLNDIVRKTNNAIAGGVA